MDLGDEARELTALIGGKTVKLVRRHRPAELMIEFDDGTRLFVDVATKGLDVSVTGGEDDHK